MELYIPNREEMHRARVEWRSGNEMGVSFGEEVHSPSVAPDAAHGRPGDARAEARGGGAALKRIVNELRAEIRKQHGEVASARPGGGNPRT